MKILISFSSFLFLIPLKAEVLLDCVPDYESSVTRVVVVQKEDRLFSQTSGEDGFVRERPVPPIEWLHETIHIEAPKGNVTSIFTIKRGLETWLLSEENRQGVRIITLTCNP